MDNAHATSWHHEICEKKQCFRAHQGERFQPCHIRQRVAWRPASVVQHASLLSQHQSLCLSRRKESPRSTKLHGNQSIYGGTYLPSKTAWNAGTLGPNSCRLVATDVKICPKPAFDAFKCRFFNISVYSHSIVPGGLEVMSYRTRLTPGTSLQMRLAHRASTSGGKRNQSAVMASSLVTARSVQTSR